MTINSLKTIRLQLTLLLSILFTIPAMAQTALKGTVLDDRTESPISGVPVQLKSTKTVVLTNENGKFNLPLDTRKAGVIQINTLGYEPVEIPVQATEFLTIRLKQSITALGEVVISSGYTLQPKSEASGAVSSISARQLTNRPAVSFDQLLGGQAPGIDIIQPSNILNNTPVMRVRGINTITSGLFPLVVVDGVTVFVGSIGGLVGNNPLSDINPSDIQSIDILKDASAAAIYGSRAANGVMVITTKKGSRSGKPKVGYDAWISRSTPYNLPKMLSAEDYMLIKNEALTNAGRPAGYFPSTNPDGSLVNTNWYDVAFRPGISHNHNLSVSGGNEATTYYFSVGYTNQNSYIKNNTFERMAARLNIDHQVGKAVKTGANITFSNGKNVGTNTGAIPSNSMASSSYNSEYITNEPLARMTYVLPPNVPVYRPDGSYSIQDGISVGYGANVPATVGTINAYNLAMVQALDLNSSENNTVIGNVFGEWKLRPNLTFRTSYGLNNLGVTNKSFFNAVHGGGASSNGIARNTATRLYRTDWVNTLLYTTTINKAHNLSVLLGQEVIKTTTDGWGAAQTNVTDPSYSNFQGGYANISPFGNVYSENALLSYFSNITYDYRKRYLLSVNLRRDGLSALADGNQWSNFGGGSVGWAISEENFYKNARLSRWVDNLKIRASYGIVGNSEIGDYPAIGTYTSNTYGGVPTLAYAQAANPDLRWEASRKVDVGLNFSMLANRIQVEFDYYRNEVDGLILKAPQALSSGLPGNYINANVGSLYNQGIELGLNALITNYRDFKWNSSLNVSTLKNRVTSLVTDVFVPSVFGVQNMTRVGYSIGSIFAVPSPGVNPANGLMMFTNAAGSDVQYNHIGSPRWTYVSDGSPAPAIDNYQDGVMQGPSLPTIFGGFNNTFQYKNFDLTVLLSFVGGNKLYNGTRATNSDQRYFNNAEFIKDRWTTPGQITEIQKLYYGDNVSAGFSFAATSKVEDGSYVKLRTISLGYHVPIKKTFLSGSVASAYLYAQGGNVFTITRYRGSDPEVSINGNSIHSGKDQNVPPNAQVVTVGLNVGF